jgi:hypothetical protein
MGNTGVAERLADSQEALISMELDTFLFLVSDSFISNL